jgi:hypothetical protein
MAPNPALEMALRQLKLPAFGQHYGRLADEAAAANLSYDRYLQALAEQELSQRDLARQRPSQNGGNYAASGGDTSVRAMAGYQRSNVGRRSSFSAWARTCSRRWAPRLVQRICCFLTKRLLTT